MIVVDGMSQNDGGIVWVVSTYPEKVWYLQVAFKHKYIIGTSKNLKFLLTNAVGKLFLLQILWIIGSTLEHWKNHNTSCHENAIATGTLSAKAASLRPDERSRRAVVVGVRQGVSG